MSSERAVGAAPLLTGIVLASRSAQELLRSGLSPWSVLGLVGGCAAVAVGAGTLLEWGGFDARTTDRSRSSTAALVGLAFLSFVVGAGLAVV